MGVDAAQTSAHISLRRRRKPSLEYPALARRWTARPISTLVKTLLRNRGEKLASFPVFLPRLEPFLFIQSSPTSKTSYPFAFGESREVGPNGGRRECRDRPVPLSSPKHLAPLREWVPREPVKKSGQSPGRPLADLLSPPVQQAPASRLPHPTNSQKHCNRRPRGLARRGLGNAVVNWRLTGLGGRVLRGKRPLPAPQLPVAWGFRGLPSWSRGRQEPRALGSNASRL